jgi:protein-disulfide isomerase
MDDYFDAVRAQLRAACEAQAHGRARSRLRWVRVRPGHPMLAASALVAVAVFVVALAGLSARSPTPAPGNGATPTAPNATVQQVAAVLRGVPQSGTILGDKRAPITITVFGDLPCSACRYLTLGSTFGRLVAHEVRSGSVKLDYRSVCPAPCAAQHKALFDTPQAAAYAAGQQDRFWDYLLLFDSLPELQSASTSDLRALAVGVGLNVGRWQHDRHGAAVAAQLRADRSVAGADHVSAIPELIVAGPTARVSLNGTASYHQVQQAIANTRPLQATAPNAIIDNCLAHGRLTHPYTKAQLRHALAVIPASVKQYTNCVSVIDHALPRGP